MPRQTKDIPWTAASSSVAQRPGLAIRIAIIANQWSYTEAQITQILATMIGTDVEVVLAILGKVKTATATVQMVQAIAKRTLDVRLVQMLDPILRKFETLAKQRNAVLHSAWAVSEEEPDALLQLPTHAWAQTVMGAALEKSEARRCEAIRVGSALLAWDQSDFDRIIAELGQLSNDATGFANTMLVTAAAKAHGADIEAYIERITHRANAET